MEVEGNLALSFSMIPGAQLVCVQAVRFPEFICRGFDLRNRNNTYWTWLYGKVRVCGNDIESKLEGCAERADFRIEDFSGHF